MDDDAELIARLCTRAGMIMEDQSLLAITLVAKDPATRIAGLLELAAATQAIQALIGAAIAIHHEAK